MKKETTAKLSLIVGAAQIATASSAVAAPVQQLRAMGDEHRAVTAQAARGITHAAPEGDGFAVSAERLQELADSMVFNEEAETFREAADQALAEVYDNSLMLWLSDMERVRAEMGPASPEMQALINKLSAEPELLGQFLQAISDAALAGPESEAGRKLAELFMTDEYGLRGLNFDAGVDGDKSAWTLTTIFTVETIATSPVTTTCTTTTLTTTLTVTPTLETPDQPV